MVILRVFVVTLTFVVTLIIPFAYMMIAAQSAAAPAACPAQGAKGKKTGLCVPRFVSIKVTQANMYGGPGANYNIVWRYARKNYPLEVVAEYDDWRRLRDIDGTEGWMPVRKLSGERHIIIDIKTDLTNLYRKPTMDEVIIARVQNGVIARLETCISGWCKIDTGDYSGWVERAHLWGVYADE